VASLRRAAADSSPAALKAVAQQVRGHPADADVATDAQADDAGGLFDTPEAQTWNSMVDQRMGEQIAKAGGIGIADALLRQIELGRTVAGGAQAAAVQAVNKP
jgi:flagellar protein FlgJ